MIGRRIVSYAMVKRQITPSRVEYWAGTMEDGDRFTAEQARAMDAMAIDPDTVETITVRRPATARELWWPCTEKAPLFEFNCPVIGPLRADGRVKVISPSGVPKLVFQDGWITKRRRAA